MVYTTPRRSTIAIIIATIAVIGTTMITAQVLTPNTALGAQHKHHKDKTTTITHNNHHHKKDNNLNNLGHGHHKKHSKVKHEVVKVVEREHSKKHTGHHHFKIIREEDGSGDNSEFFGNGFFTQHRDICSFVNSAEAALEFGCFGF